MKRILYLGLDPSRWKGEGFLIHYPMIQTEPLGEFTAPEATDLLFTSRTAVEYWGDFEEKRIFAIGKSTAEKIREKGGEPLIAAEATQEGVIALFEQINWSGRFLVWPRSVSARPLLASYLERKKISFRAIDLYRTTVRKQKPFPDLTKIDEIVFTSPSTVRAFVEIYGRLPDNKILTPIGPVTAGELMNLNFGFLS